MKKETFTNRSKSDVNLVDVASKLLEELISTDAKNRFINDKNVSRVKDEHPKFQQVIINSYFVNMLLQWRADHKKPVYTTISYLHNDGDPLSWVESFGYVVVPFIKSNQIMGVPLVNTK